MRIVYLLCLALAISFPGHVFAQRSGGGGGAGHGQGGQSGQGGQPSSAAAGQGSGQSSQATSSQAQRDRLRTQVTTQQRDQYKDCNQSMSRLSTQTRDMSRMASGSAFNADEARRQQSQMRDQFRDLEQNRTKLTQQLNSEQRTAIETRTKSMDRLQERINTRLGTIDKELQSATPNRNRIASEANAAERETHTYQNEFRKMGDELGVNSN